jgi:hypothetical protein
VREIVFAASGCRAIASIAAATARPFGKRGPEGPEGDRQGGAEDAGQVEIIHHILFRLGVGAVGGRGVGHVALDRCGDEHHRQNREDVGLYQSDKHIERHQRDRNQQPRQRGHDPNDENTAHHIAEQAHEHRKRSASGF